MDRANLLESLLALLEQNQIRYCVIGDQGVNAYADPLVGLDLDLVVAVEQVQFAEALLKEHFKVERFPHSINVSMPGSNLRVQMQTDPRYFEFVGRAAARDLRAKASGSPS